MDGDGSEYGEATVKRRTIGRSPCSNVWGPKKGWVSDGSGGGVRASVADMEPRIPVEMFTVPTSKDIFQALCKSKLEPVERNMV